MLQNSMRLSGHLVPEKFPQMSFAAEARLANPGALAVTDEPDEQLPTGGIRQTAMTATPSPTFGGSGLTTRATTAGRHSAREFLQWPFRKIPCFSALAATAVTAPVVHALFTDGADALPLKLYFSAVTAASGFNILNLIEGYLFDKRPEHSVMYRGFESLSQYLVAGHVVIGVGIMLGL